MKARSSIVVAGTAAMLLLSSAPGWPQTGAEGVDPAAGGYHLPQAEVPYAIRGESFLRMVGLVQRADHEAGLSASDEGSSARRMLENYGLDPNSPAGRHLIEISAEYFEEHYAPLVAARRELGPGEAPPPRNYGLPLERYERAGEAMGRWLRAREAEGWAAAPLIDRLLNSQTAGVGLMTTDGGREAAIRSANSLAKAFELGLRRELGYLPRGFGR